MEPVKRQVRSKAAPTLRRASMLSAAAMAIGALTLVPMARLEAAEPLEYKIKAAFLLNFTKFIEWPSSDFEGPNSPFTICILGKDPFGSVLDEIVAGEAVEGRKIVVQRIKRAPASKACQVLFAARTGHDLNPLLHQLPAGILTVGEDESFMHDGGMIAFVIENRRVRFIINQGLTEGSGLKLSSKLLSVARVVDRQ